MNVANLLIGLSIAGPGVAALVSGLRSRMHPMLGLTFGLLVSTLWAVPVGLVLILAADSAAGGPLWALMLTAVALVEWWDRAG